MSDFELILVLLVIVAVIVTVARRLHIPYPIMLVIGGLIVGFAPGLPRVTLDPEVVLVVFLPPLILAAAWQTPIRDLKKNIRPVLSLSVGLVLFTTFLVGLVAHAIVPGLELVPALVLGAIVSPPDALAASTVLQRLSVPRPILRILEQESLLNDAAALTTYRVAVAAAITGSFILGDAVAAFIYAAAAGAAIGLVVAVAAGWLWSRLFDPPVEVTLSLVIPYAVFIPAEHLGASGVIAAVTAGLYLSARSSRIMAPDARILAGGVWEIVTFLLNGAAFILIGLQLPTILDSLADRPADALLIQAAVVVMAVIAARFLWVFPATYLRRLFTGSKRRTRALRPSVPLVISWAGMRGVISLAAALALPSVFPQREVIIYLTFAVILATLVGQGLTLPLLVRLVGLSEGGEVAREEREARMRALEAALSELGRLRQRWPDHAPMMDNLELGFAHRVEHLVEEEAKADGDDEDDERSEHRAIVSAVINAEREAIIGLRDRGVIGDEVLRRIERELDLEQLRLESEI